MGFLYAFLAFLLIGSYLVPARMARARGLAFLPYMGMGLLVLSPAMAAPLLALWANPTWFWVSILSGLLWALGQASANHALEEISLAKASVFFNVNTFLNMLLGIALFNEAAGFKRVFFLCLGGVLLFLGAWIVSSAQAARAKERNLRKGALYSLLAALLWGFYFTPVVALRKFGSSGDMDPMAVLAGLMLGGGFFAVVLGLAAGKFKWRGKDALSGLATAVLWSLGTAAFLLAIGSLGLSRAVPLINANTLVYAAWSLFVFKELPSSQAARVLGGTVLVVLGIGLLTVS